MIKNLAVSLLLVSSFVLATACYAQAPAPEAKSMTADEFVASLKFKQGKVDLPGGIATLNLPDTFRYLEPADATRVLVDAWGNPPGTKTLGMIFPATVSPLANDSWGVVITYDEDGHVNDGDADNINYDDLLKDMQESSKAANEERKKRGYDSLTLVGWAEKPSYDKANHKMYWAKELASEKATQHTLNYGIRVLGRKGVLVLNAVAGMNQIGAIKTEMQKVVAFSEFTQGNRYADFDNKTDRVAEYGLAALVAGGVAAKLGFFGKIFAFLLAFKKLLIFGAIALFAGVAKLFSRKR